MFSNLNKPAFGSAAPNTSFGFGSTTTANANPFGQNQLFGKPATGSFGSPSTSTFGQPANTSLFPSTQAQPTNLFQNANTTFGTPASTPGGFGTSNLFGQQQPSSSGLFNTSSTFGQQNKPTGFGFGTQPTQPSLFGQQPQQQQTSSLFQPSSSNLFGGTTAFGGQQATGTVIKFNPVTGTDTMMKNGVAQSINTKHHSITCMKEYENKSFEELRFEDYLANRKGPGFGTTPFGPTASSASSLFGQPDASKPAFGQTTGFGQTPSTFGQNTSSFGITSQPQQSGGLFGKPTGFGAPTNTTATFGFGGTTQTANPFGSNQAAKPFGSTTQPIFGTSTNTTQQSGFGTGLFGQTPAQNTAGSLFGKPAQPTTGFGAAQNTSGFSFGPPTSTQASSLFQPNKPLFGQTTTATGFGQTNSFGTTNPTPFGSSFAKPAAPAFGTAQPSGFGSTLGGIQNQGSSLFGNTVAKPGGLFGNTGSTGLFGNTNTTFQPGTGFGLQQQQPQQSLFPPPEQQAAPNLALLTTDPFGDAPHLAGLEPKIKSNSSSVSATDPKELKALLDPQKKVDMSHNSKLKVFPLRSVRDSLFDGVSPKFNGENQSSDYIKTNCRRLILKQKPDENGDGNSPGLMRTDILKHITSAEENKNTSNQGSKSQANLSNDLRTTPLRTTPLRINFDSTINETQNSPISSQTYNIINTSINKNSISNKTNKVPSLSDDDEEPIELAAGDTPKVHPCGIICTRPEYYTLPGLDGLDQYVDENGSCIVKGFTIGRKGYGNVYFPDEMDVGGLNIDELVHFRYREINVYPDESKKPPIGQGLNRKAQVTLDNVYPRRADTNTLIKDVSELLQMNFAEKLRRVTVKKGAKFIDYRPETGSWVFKVDHFSRYGFNDSDDDSEQNDKEALKKKIEAAQKPPNGLQKTATDITNTDIVQEKEQSKKDKAKVGLDMDIFVEDQFITEDDLHESMYIDEDDYQTVPMDFAVPFNLPYDTFRPSKNIQIMKSTLFADDDRFSDEGSHTSVIKQFYDIEDIPQLPIIREEVLSRKRTILRPRVDKVYNYGSGEIATGIIPNRSYIDLGIYKGKSFKVGWLKGFNFFSLNTKKGEINGQVAWNTIDISLTAKDFDPLKDFLKESLDIVLEESSYHLDSDGIPTFEILKNDSYLKKQTELFSKLATKYNGKEAQYLYSIWTLAESLWGPEEDKVYNRRHLVSEWLKANTNYNELSTTSIADEIFNQLTVFRILEAANLAMEKRLPNLALLISQSSITNRTKMFLQEQIENWYSALTANHIDDNMKRIYLLLSGIPVKNEINVFQDVDWKRAFGMHLWYICPNESPIEIAIDLFKKAFEEESYAERPNPPYKNFYDEGSFDVLYHMLLLYKSGVHRLCSVLNPATHTDDPLDYRLSWLLLQLFLSLDVGLIDASEKNKLSISFANQLEYLGNWEWAIFVLLYLEDNALKKNLIMGILDRNLSPEVDKKTLDSQSILVNKMQIPPAWIHVVKGTKTLLLGRYFHAFNHLAYAQDYCKANEVLIEHLLPGLFINEQYDIIKILINAIQEGSANILHWKKEAGLFSDFLDLQENVISFRAEDLLKLQMKIQSIGDRISTFTMKTDQQKLCIAEMSKRCASVYKEICKKSKAGLFKYYSDFIETLVMPPDFKQNEALYLINEFDSFRC